MKNESFLKKGIMIEISRIDLYLSKKMPITIFLNRKFASTKKFLTKKFHPNFLIVKSSNWKDLYTTYSKISVN